MALLREVARLDGHGHRRVPPVWASMWQGPLRLGAIQQILDRVTRALTPHDTALALQTRQAPVHYSEAPLVLRPHSGVALRDGE